MRVLFVAAECFPLIKTGGLADVAGALPLALAKLGVDVRVLLPAYPAVHDGLAEPQEVAALPELFGGPARLVAGTAAGGLKVLALDAPHLYDRPGNPYLDADGEDWADNDLRYAALSWVAAEIGQGRLGTWWPHLVHAHDWQAGLALAYLAFEETRPATVFTIHNLAFQGLFPAARLEALKLPEAALSVDGLEFYGQIGFLKAGLVYADGITTVSPTYAREIQTEADGMGLDGVLRGRGDVLTGIVNGIDTEIWIPETDPAIDAPYGARRLRGKGIDKMALQERFALDVDQAAPLFCVVSRLTEQKGLDLLLDALPELLDCGGQLAVLGSGAGWLEDGYRAAAESHVGRVGVVIGYDEPLSHRMQAGADAILVPSRFEPCGLTQLCGLRYGTLPVVARVGGLADTVIDANDAALRDGVATGFQFAPVTAEALGFAIRRACALYADRRRWQAMQRRAMSREVGWAAPAADYLALYRSLAPAPAAALAS